MGRSGGFFAFGYTGGMAKFLLHTLGSSGDINPFVALGLELRRRGHEVRFAVNPANAVKIAALGFEAVSIGPDPDFQSDLMRRMLTPDPLEPIRVLYREVLIPGMRPAFDALLPLVRECDVFVSHIIQLAARALATRTGVPWVSASPATLAYPTGHTPPPGVAWKNGPAWLSRLSWAVARRLFRRLTALANVEYARLGAPPVADIISGVFSTRLSLGLWSPSFSPRPPDWPDWMQVGGYARWDGPSPADAAPVVLPSGDGPLVVFTLGSAVVNQPLRFWETALEALAPTHWRAFLLGAPADFAVPAALRSRVKTVRYAPYADVFARASAVVHQGGVGTTQAACFYGVPSLVVPRGFDQFENAAHVQREGWGLRGSGADTSALLMRARLKRLLDDGEIRRRVTMLGERMQAEPGVAASADKVEAVLETLTAPSP